MKRQLVTQLLRCAFVSALIFAVAPALAQDKKPNIVFILTDNLGYGDIGAFGDRPVAASTRCLYGRRGRGSRRPRRQLAQGLRRRHRWWGAGSTGRPCRVAQPSRCFKSAGSFADGARLLVRQDARDCVTRNFARG
jgi:hypothetical protein